MLQLNALWLASPPLQHTSNIKEYKNEIVMKNDNRNMKAHPERASFSKFFNILFVR
jgi:hypothetical protein